MATLNQSLLPVALIRRYVSDETWAKGRGYQTGGRVLKLELVENKPGAYTATGAVVGSRLYTTLVGLQLVDNQLQPKTSQCSCPVGNRCKHVAALLLELGHRGVELKDLRPDWRRSVEALLGDDQAVGAGSVRVALHFEVKEDRYSGYYYYQKPTSTRSKYFLAVRIAAPSASTGKWALNQFLWQDMLGSSSKLSLLNPNQRDVLQTFWLLYLTMRSDSEQWLRLDNFSNGRLWSLLDEAQQAGIPLISAGKTNAPIYTDHTCKLELSVAEKKTGDLELSPQLLIDGAPVGKGISPHLVGKPPIGLYWSSGSHDLKQHQIHVARFTEPPRSFLLEAWQNGGALTVPGQDSEEFAREYFPKIARHNPVNTKKVKRVALVTPELPKLHIAVGGRPAGINVHLGFAYQTADDRKVLPYGDDRSAGHVVRDQPAEQRLIVKFSGQVSDNPAWFEEVRQPGAATIVSKIRSSVILSGLDAVQFVQATLPELTKDPDYSIDLSPDLPAYSQLTDAPTISYEVSKQDDGSQDWFNLGVTVTVGDTAIPFEPLFAALAENETSLLLDNGQYLLLNHPELLKLRQLIIEARQLSDKPAGELSISRFQASLWDELQQLGIVSRQATEWDAAVKGLLDVKAIPKLPAPSGLKATLRPYQQEGYQWLHFLWSHRLGGILADDMGLGKTLQTIALILAIKAAATKKTQQQVLIIAPTSVAANWLHELEHFVPSLKLAYIRQVAGDGEKLAQQIEGVDVVVSSYGLFRLDFAAYSAQAWAALVLDEAQFVKNHQSKGYQNARKLHAEFKLVLTGTPLENNLMELWALLSIVAPGLFPSPKHFGEFYQKPIEKEANADKLKQLRKRVRPLMLRRTKEQVATELPPKIEQIIELELNPEHRKIYDTYLQRERQRVLGLLGDINKNRFMIFKSLTSLRLLSLAPSLVDEKKYQHVPSTKLAALTEQLQEILAENHRVLIFSQFTSFLKLVQAELVNARIKYCYLDGSTTNRAGLLTEFKTTSIPVFLISLKAGGFGLNLTEADYCILLDPWWNPAAEQQAVDRTHRIGQTKQVIVYRLVAKNTIEEKVMALKAKKSKLFASMLDENAPFAANITPDDVRQLFE